MKAVFRNYFSALSNGAYLLLLLYAAAYPLVTAAHYARFIELGPWLDLSPALCWRGEIWRLVTYAFIPNGVIDWVVSLLWLTVLVGVLGRRWSSRELWTCGLIPILAGALVIVVLMSGRQKGIVGNAALVFGLLPAWYELNGRERITIPGIGGVRVRQAVLVMAMIEVLLSYLWLGWLATLAMMCGGGAGWGYLRWRRRQLLKDSARLGERERVRRL